MRTITSFRSQPRLLQIASIWKVQFRMTLEHKSVWSWPIAFIMLPLRADVLLQFIILDLRFQQTQQEISWGNFISRSSWPFTSPRCHKIDLAEIDRVLSCVTCSAILQNNISCVHIIQFSSKEVVDHQPLPLMMMKWPVHYLKKMMHFRPKIHTKQKLIFGHVFTRFGMMNQAVFFMYSGPNQESKFTCCDLKQVKFMFPFMIFPHNVYCQLY